MNRQNRRDHRKLIDIRSIHPLWARIVAGLAAVVMFCTVYSLILPAAAATGGPGTKLFTILGLAMMLGAGVMLFQRRRLI